MVRFAGFGLLICGALLVGVAPCQAESDELEWGPAMTPQELVQASSIAIPYYPAFMLFGVGPLNKLPTVELAGPSKQPQAALEKAPVAALFTTYGFEMGQTEGVVKNVFNGIGD